MVEHDLAKVGVEGSSPFARSNLSKSAQWLSRSLRGERLVAFRLDMGLG